MTEGKAERKGERERKSVRGNKLDTDKGKRGLLVECEISRVI